MERVIGIVSFISSFYSFLLQSLANKLLTDLNNLQWMVVCLLLINGDMEIRSSIRQDAVLSLSHKSIEAFNATNGFERKAENKYSI